MEGIVAREEQNLAEFVFSEVCNDATVRTVGFLPNLGIAEMLGRATLGKHVLADDRVVLVLLVLHGHRQ
jgi:hypothetical protein